MKKSLRTSLIFFIILFPIEAFLFKQLEASSSSKYEFLILAFCGSSAVFAVPILQYVFRKKVKKQSNLHSKK